MSRFQTLLQREWMQHHRGWLILMTTPPALVLVVVAFVDALHIEPQQSPMALMLACTIVGMLLALAATEIAVLFQSSGLARRDEQDRSIEFWLSLPVSHSSSVGATVLMHALLVPMLALGVGYVLSQVIGLVAVARTGGVASVLGLPWGVLVASSIAVLLRAAFGLVLATFWALPLVLLPMAASAWLKRWGVPVLLIGLGSGHAALKHFYGVTGLADTARAWLLGAAHSMLNAAPPAWGHGPEQVWDDRWPLITPLWLAQDAFGSLIDLAQPAFALSLAVSAACFALLVMRRKQSG